MKRDQLTVCGGQPMPTTAQTFTTTPVGQQGPENFAPMDGMAREWEEEFEFLERHTRADCYARKLESFLVRLHSSAHRFEPQSDGSRLLIFSDGTVYGEESELDRLLDRARCLRGKLIPMSGTGLRVRTPQLRRKGHK
jgi:hypothetical protein